MAYSLKAGDEDFAKGGKSRGGETRFTKKTVSEKHLPDQAEAPNQFTDNDTDDAPKGRGKWQDKQNYGKGK